MMGWLGATSDAGFAMSCGGGNTPGCVTSGFAGSAARYALVGETHPPASASNPAASALNLLFPMTPPSLASLVECSDKLAASRAAPRAASTRRPNLRSTPR